MKARDREEDQLRSAALQNMNSILAARQRAEEELIAARDALEQRSAELARSLAMMRATLESTTDGILVTDGPGRITGFNQTFVRMWNVPRALIEAGDHRRLLELTSRSFADPQAFLARIEEIYATAPETTTEVLELADGRVFERHSRIQVVDHQVVGRVWSFRDVTESRRLYESARRAATDREGLLDRERGARADAERTSAMKDEFLATLSHELRTPLTAILGWATVLRRRGLTAEDLVQGLEIIERNARVQTQLIEDLLDMNRITSGKVRLDVQPVAPIEFIEASLASLRPAAEARGIRIETLLDPGAGPVMGDPGRLQQVMWNLLSNAIKFTPRNGRVQVVLERVNSHLEITIADNGAGIDPEFLPHVFDRFRQADASTTRSQGGLGLGLAIVKSLVEMHGGVVRITSPGRGQGTTVVVDLPLTVAHRGTLPEPRRHPGSVSVPLEADLGGIDLTGVRVLFVDDQPDARELVRRILSDCGAEMLTAADGEEALAIVERQHPHVLVSDIGMPAMDGHELLRRIRALGRERGGGLPAIALSAFARGEDRTRARRAGFLVYLTKPVEPSELVAAIAAVARSGEREPI